MNQYQDVKAKTNYAIAEILKLKTNTIPPNLVEWIKSISNISSDQLHKIVRFVQQLIDFGYDPQKAAEQYKYIADLQAYDRIEQLLTQVVETNSNSLGVETQLFESGETIFFLQEVGNKVDKGLLKQEELDITEGFFVFTINKLKLHDDGIIYDESNGTVKFTIQEDFDNQQYIYAISDLPTTQSLITLSTPFDELKGFQAITNILNNDQHIIHFEKLDQDVYELQSLKVTIDANELYVDLAINSTIQINSKQLLTILNPLPRNCQIITTTFPISALNSDLLSYHVEFQSVYLEHRILSIKSTILTDFDRKFSKDITYGLYGQSALVTLSTLTESLKTVVRKLKVDYTHKIGSQVTVPLVPEMLQKYDLPYERQNRLDVFGPCVVPSTTNRDFNYVGMLKEADYPKFRLYDPQGAVNGTGFSLPNYRSMAKTGILLKKRDDGTSLDVPYFVECEVKVNNQQKPVSGNFVRIGGIETDTIDIVPIWSIWNGSRLNLWAFNLNIGSDDQAFSTANTEIWNPATIYIGAKIAANVTRTYRVIIRVDDVSSVDTTPPTATITYIRARKKKEITIPLVFESLQFGQSQFINCYVGILETEQVDDIFYVGMPVSCALEEISQDVYTSVDQEWKPTNIQKYNYPGSKIDTTQESMNNFEYWMLTRQPESDGARPMAYVQRKLKLLNRKSIYGPNPRLQSAVPGNSWPFIDTTPTALKKYQWHIIIPTDSRITGKGFGTIQGFNPIYNFGLVVKWKSDNGKPVLWNKNVKFFKYEAGVITTTEKWFIHDYDVIEHFPPFTNDISIESKDYLTSKGNIEIMSLDFNTSELILPTNILNQDSIGKSIIELQRAVRMLESYAVYLEYYIQNIDKRLVFVEDTLKKVVNVLNDIINPSIPEPSGWNIATTILNFIGQGIGMFFPLIGMAISAIGLAVTGIGEIVNGDILAGVFDLAFAAILSSVGAYKFSQRLKRKYGGDKLPELETKHNMAKIGEKLGTTVIENKVIILVTSNSKPSSAKGTAMVRTNDITKVNDSEIEFTTGTIVTPAINRAKWATVVKNKIPDLDVISGRTSLSTKRITTYKKEQNGNYTVSGTLSQTGVGYVNRANKTSEYAWRGFTDAEVATFTRCNVTSSTYANMIDSVAISKLRGANSGSIGIDLDVAAEFLTRLGYKVNRQAKYSTYASQKSRRLWMIKPFNLLEDDSVSYQVSSNTIYTGLNDNYQSQDSMTTLISEVIGS